MKWKNISIGLRIVAALALVFFALSYLNVCKENRIERENTQVALDSVQTIKLKNDNLLYQNSMFRVKNKELTDVLDITKQEKRELERKVGKLETLVKAKGKIQIDTVVTTKDSTVYVDHTLQSYYFTYKDNWFSVSGMSKIQEKTTTLFNTEMDVPLTIGTTKKNKIFITTPNPYVHFSEIKGAEVQEKALKRKWSIGLTVGAFGIYNPADGKVYFGPGAGFGVTYKLF